VIEIVFAKYQSLLTQLNEHASVQQHLKSGDDPHHHDNNSSSGTTRDSSKNGVDFFNFTNFYHMLKRELKIKLKSSAPAEYNHLIAQSNYHLSKMYYRELMNYCNRMKNDRLNDELSSVFHCAMATDDSSSHSKKSLSASGGGSFKNETLDHSVADEMPFSDFSSQLEAMYPSNYDHSSMQDYQDKETMSLFYSKEETSALVHSWPVLSPVKDHSSSINSGETERLLISSSHHRKPNNNEHLSEEDLMLFDPYDDQDLVPREIVKKPWSQRIYRWVSKVFPWLNWIPEYRHHIHDLKSDLVAGITVGVMLIPQAMGYALIGGFPPIYGLYTAMIPMFMYSFLGTSRQLSIGPSAMVSLILMSELESLGVKIDQDPELYIMYSLMITFFTGLTQLLMGVLRLGFLVNFLSMPVIHGFSSAAAIVIGLSQLGNFTGVSMPSENRVHYIVYNFGRVVHMIHFPTLLLSITSLLLLIFLEKSYIETGEEKKLKIAGRTFKLPRRLSLKFLPAPLVIVVAGIVVMYLVKAIGHYDPSNKEVFGIKITGHVPPGPPKPLVPFIPGFNFETILELSTAFLTIALVVCVESISIAKFYAIQKGYNIDPNQELIALGMASTLGAFFRALPANTSLARTAVNSNSGAVTQLSGFVSAVFVLISLWILTPLFYYLPNAVLAALIIFSCSKLIHLDQVLFTFKTKKRDCVALVLAFAGSMFIGIKEGVLIAALASLVLFILRSTRPRFHILGRRPGTTAYLEVKRWKDCKEIPGILVMRFDSDLWFANVSFFTEQLHRAIRKSPYPVYAVVLDCSGINQVDSTAVNSMKSLKESLDGLQISLFIAQMKRSMRVVMKRGGINSVMKKEEHFFDHLHDAVLHAENITRKRRIAELSKNGTNKLTDSEISQSAFVISVDEGSPLTMENISPYTPVQTGE